jgi:DNA modification methylase
LVESVPLSRLKPAPWNPRLIRDERFASLVRSIEADPEFMQLRPILATTDGTIYAGNMRYRAAAKAGWTEVPVILNDIDEVTAKARAVRDNNGWGEWQDEELSELLHGIGDAGIELADLGFDDAVLSRLLGLAEPVEGLTDPDEVPPLGEETNIKRGDLFALGDHRLMCGDATSPDDVARLLGGDRPALTVTDPPYGVDYDPNWRNEAAEKGLLRWAPSRTGAVANDGRNDWAEAWLLSPSAIAYCWHAGVHAANVQSSLEAAGFIVRSQIIWAKPRLIISRGAYHWQHEPCWYAVRKGESADWAGDRSQTTLWEVGLPNSVTAAKGEELTNHGTQKPVELMERPLRNHKGDVYDPFIGSGTTMIAAERQGRRCYGMDIDPRYVAVAIERWENFTGHKAERV